MEGAGTGTRPHDLARTTLALVCLGGMIVGSLWVLRPFIGSPERPFEWFRSRESHFFEAVWRALVQLFS